MVTLFAIIPDIYCEFMLNLFTCSYCEAMLLLFTLLQTEC